MKNRFDDEMDPELEQKIRGLSVTQIELMADILEGIGDELTRTAAQKRAANNRRQNARN